MKAIVRMLILALLLLGFSTALGETAVNCYWQLEAVEVSSRTLERYGPAQAGTDAEPLLLDDPAAMMEAVCGGHTLSLLLERETTSRSAQAQYTLGGMPALIPGAACARLDIASSTRSDEQSFYLYLTADADGSRLARIRGTGA